MSSTISRTNTPPSAWQTPENLSPAWRRGWSSVATLLVFPFAKLFRSLFLRYQTPAHYERGLILVLPGIEANSFLSLSVARGLCDAGWQGAIEVYDWTTGFNGLFLYHLRATRRNRRQAQQLAQRILDYQRDYPGRPVSIIGHSGGGAITAWTLEALPENAQIESAVLLNSALSPRYSLVAALRHVRRGLLAVSSLGDIFFCGIGTTLCGTMDGRWGPAAAMLGFRPPAELTRDERALYAAKLDSLPYQPEMLGHFHCAGHFGCTNRVFVEKWIAVWLRDSKLPGRP